MDKREKSRADFQFRTEITYGDERVEGEVENLSVKGMLLKTEKKINPGISVAVILHLSGKTSRLTLNFMGEVARQESDGIAVEFTDIDTDSFIHLRNIINHTVLNEQKIAKEFDDAILDEDVKD